MLVEPKRGPPCSQVLCLQALSSTQLTSVAPCPLTHPGLARLGSFSRIPWVLSGSLASHCTLTRFSCPGFGPEPLIFPQKAVGKNLPTVISGHLPQPLLYSRGSAAHLQATSQDADFPAPTKQSACPSRRLPSHCPAQPPGGQQARHQEAGRQWLLYLLGASLSRSRVPNCPLGSDPSLGDCTPSGGHSRRVKWPVAAAGRWEPIMAIFNLIKAVSTIDFSSFNY